MAFRKSVRARGWPAQALWCPPRTAIVFTHALTAHLTHTRASAQVCGPAVFNNASLGAAIHSAFQYWQARDFQNSNWWW
jgi:hypothetical protein